MHNRPSALNYIDYSRSCTGISEWHFYETWLLLKHSHKHLNDTSSSQGTDSVCAVPPYPSKALLGFTAALPRCRGAFLCISLHFPAFLCCQCCFLWWVGNSRWAEVSPEQQSPRLSLCSTGSCSPALGQSWALGGESRKGIDLHKW